MSLTRRTGVTMRVVRSDYGEVRDALARDWPVLLERLCKRRDPAPEWFLLPNIGEDCVALARRYGVRALLLTGGDDIGATPDRDQTEAALLRWAAGERLPVLGVCRGAQVLARHAGATLTELQERRHVAARHPVAWRLPAACSPFWRQVLPREGTANVNSYHRWGLTPAALPPCLQTVAVCAEDGSVEAFCHAELPWLGLFWHPEREAEPDATDLALLHNLLFAV